MSWVFLQEMGERGELDPHLVVPQVMGEYSVIFEEFFHARLQFPCSDFLVGVLRPPNKLKPIHQNQQNLKQIASLS
jgi:hypothetical protein